jgi:hypothetical protein
MVGLGLLEKMVLYLRILVHSKRRLTLVPKLLQQVNIKPQAEY